MVLGERTACSFGGVDDNRIGGLPFVADPEHCQRACEMEPNCNSYQYSTEYFDCHFYKGTPVQVHHEKFVCGITCMDQDDALRTWLEHVEVAGTSCKSLK